MIRLSVTDLDGYLYWRESEDMTFDAFLTRLRGGEPPTQAMLAGRAFHKVFELATPGDIPVAVMDGFEFVFDVDQSIAIPEIRELKGEVVFDTASGPVTLVGKVDALNGTTVHDYKLTERFEAERYIDSHQWRSYLTMFSAGTFVYDVFQARYDEQRVTIYDYHRLQFHAYPAMRDDVHRVVSELAAIVATHVPEKIKEAA